MIQHTYELIALMADGDNMTYDQLVKGSESYEVLMATLKRLIKDHKILKNGIDDYNTIGYEIRGYFITIPHDELKHYDRHFTILQYMF